MRRPASISLLSGSAMSLLATLLVPIQSAAAAPRGRHTKPRIVPAARTPARPAAPRPTPPAPAEKTMLAVPGLRSDADRMSVQAALLRLDGVQNASVDLKSRLVLIDYQPAITSPQALLAACHTAGFSAEPYDPQHLFPKPIKTKGG